ncbi:glycerol-3-phosphate dehydrogenase [Tumebacillus sp. BK434]|uniref:glycerol-3-phosphate dehydrogenase/oxidase n=1 Tax=Tumebacillus sp. BK434 TaxID=2512169 RepID=UPI00104A59CD|nr:glycerol-3-phosphate dehydrogenase/oxidase [Tumebacillus sp. BK434]TCP55954.1 glycerol-3-phosphate dehydrogenase [Tumebacillus sp. BK434]
MTESGWMGRPRSYWVGRLRQDVFDLIIIGGGITGAGIAREAALAGLRVAVLEAADFAAGTSSRSTKLIHGGLRYLAQGHVRLVREAGTERAVLRRLAPHLVEPVPFLLPIYQGMQHGKLAMSTAIWLYDRLAGVAKAERRQVLSAAELLQTHPQLAPQGLQGGVLYHEYVTDDARLTLATLQSAAEWGAVALNDCPVQQLLTADGKLCGVVGYDRVTGQPIVVSGRAVVNAAGPWIEHVLALEAAPGELSQHSGGQQVAASRQNDRLLPDDNTPASDGRTLARAPNSASSRVTHSRGIHLSFDAERLPLPHALAVQTPDGRLVFLIPKGDITYVGTTDQRYDGDLQHPVVPSGEIDYLLSIANGLRPDLHLTGEDVIGIWSGVRPLVKEEKQDTKDVSREDEIWVSPAGLITIAGGKLTAYRKMAERVLATVREQLGVGGDWQRRDELSASLPLYGAKSIPGTDIAKWWQSELKRLTDRHAVAETDARALLHRYGDRVEAVLSCGAAKRLVPSVPLLEAEIPYMVQHEQANHLDDIIGRRTELGRFRGRQLRELITLVSQRMAPLLGWTEPVREQEVERSLRECHVT